MSKDIQKAHNGAINLNDVQDKIITIRKQNVILDSDAASLYGVGTKEINQAVRNNPAKFPRGFIIELKSSEFYDVRSKILTAKTEKTRVLPKAFTEQGLYMLATILKGDMATATTIAIVQAFARLRELSRMAADSEENKLRPLTIRKGLNHMIETFSYCLPQAVYFKPSTSGPCLKRISRGIPSLAILARSAASASPITLFSAIHFTAPS